MAKLLLIETADEVCGVGMVENGKLLIKEEVIEKNAHSRLVNGLVESVLQKSKLSFNDIDGIAVSKGPGSYTGLRIGAATAKAFCYALNIPLIAVNTLHSLTSSFIQNNIISDQNFLMPMLDARRMEVYTALYDYRLDEITTTTALVLSSESINVWTENKNVILFGNGASKCKDLIGNLGNVSIIDNIKPSVEGLVQEATNKFNCKAFEDIAYFEPFYLKDFLITSSRNKIL